MYWKKREIWNRADGLNVLCIPVGSGEDEGSLEASDPGIRRIGADCTGGSGLAGGNSTRDRGRGLGPDRRGSGGRGTVWIGLLVRLAPGRAGGGGSAGLGPGRGRRAGGRGGHGRGGGRGRAGRCAAAGPGVAARRGMARADRTVGRQRDDRRDAGDGRGRARLRDARLDGDGPTARGGRGGRNGLGTAVSDEWSAGPRGNARRSARIPRWRRGWPASSSRSAGSCRPSSGRSPRASRPPGRPGRWPRARRWRSSSARATRSCKGR